MQLEQAPMNVQERVDSFESFKLCGPLVNVSAYRMLGDDAPVEILEERSDWSHITKDRPVQDCRTENLAGLLPNPRAVLKKQAEMQSERKPSFGMR